MIEVITAADDSYFVEKVIGVGPHFAFSREPLLVFNHITASTTKLFKPTLTLEEEAELLAELFGEHEVRICVNVLGIFELADVETYEELAEMDVEDDFYLEGTILDAHVGQLRLATKPDEDDHQSASPQFIPYKLIDSVELASGSMRYEFEGESEAAE